MLYIFKELSSYLDENGFPPANQRWVQIVKRDLTKEEQAGNLNFKEDGIYLKINGKEYKGYMYLKYPNVERFGMPKYHITNCRAIVGQRERGNFDNNYFWHNSKTVTIEDRVNGQIYDDINLVLCGNCQQLSQIDQYSDTMGFFDLLDLQEIEDTKLEIQLDMFGRPLDWDQLSKEYRQEMNYTCEKCGFGGEMLESKKDREFIHTDHIVAWQLTNMKRENLQCLCILCHSEKDDLHRKNFSKPGMQKRIKRFLDKYREQLIRVGNDYA